MQTFQGYDALLQASPVFYDIAPEEIHAMLDCLSAKTLSYPKGSFLFHYGDHLDSLGLVVEGCVDVMKEDFWGNTNLMTRCRPRRHLRRILCHPYKLCAGSQPLRRAEFHCALLKRLKNDDALLPHM